MNTSEPLTCFCASPAFEPYFHYDAPPDGEVRFEFSGGSYARDVLRCASCGHFRSMHSMDEGALYSGEYLDSTYGDAEGMRRTFDKINALPPKNSDNLGRARRVHEFSEAYWSESPRGRAALDVGSGLCVFPYRGLFPSPPLFDRMPTYRTQGKRSLNFLSATGRPIVLRVIDEGVRREDGLPALPVAPVHRTRLRHEQILDLCAIGKLLEGQHVFSLSREFQRNALQPRAHSSRAARSTGRRWAGME